MDDQSYLFFAGALFAFVLCGTAWIMFHGDSRLSNENIESRLRRREEENRRLSAWFEHGQCEDCKKRGLESFRQMREEDNNVG
jgi:hypothetical protein